MKILVTGGSGFIGSHLVSALNAGDHDVWTLSRRAGNKKTILGDLTVPPLMDVAKENFDVVYHLAAESSITKCIEDPTMATRVNAIGTQNLLEALRPHPPKQFIFVSSVYVYGMVNIYPTPEFTHLHPQNMLGASKMAAEYIARAYEACYDIPTVVFRPFTVYGPGSGAHQIIPTLMREATLRQFLALRDAKATRDFIHVSDVVRALTQPLEKSVSGQTFNLGTGVETSIQSLAALILKSVNRPTLEIRIDELKKRTDERRASSRMCADISLAKKLLSWQPTISLEKGLLDLARQIKN